MSRFFALLALVAGTSAVALLGIHSAGAVSAVGRRLRTATAASMGPQALGLAWLVAATATFGSLYYSEVAGLIPCELCWYQRIAMYPLAIVLGVAALRGDLRARAYALPLSIAGLVLAAYHYSLQLNPGRGPSVCSADVPCSAMLVRQFGFVSIPFMAACGFAAITALLLTTINARPRE